MKTFVAFILVSLLLPLSASAGETGFITISGNLDASSSITPPPGPDPTYDGLNTSATFSAFTQVQDSLNFEHTLSFYFFHTGVSHWLVQVYVDGGDVSGGTAGLPKLAGLFSLFFTRSGERVDVPAYDTFVIAAWNTGARPSTANVSANPITQLASASSIGSIVDGGTTGCNDLTLCISSSLPLAIAQCAGTSISCPLPVTDSVVTTENLLNASIAKQNCSRDFKSAKSCRRCFEKAESRLRYAEKSRLFGNFIKNTLSLLGERKSSTCSRFP